MNTKVQKEAQPAGRNAKYLLQVYSMRERLHGDSSSACGDFDAAPSSVLVSVASSLQSSMPQVPEVGGRGGCL